MEKKHRCSQAQFKAMGLHTERLSSSWERSLLGPLWHLGVQATSMKALYIANIECYFLFGGCASVSKNRHHLGLISKAKWHKANFWKQGTPVNQWSSWAISTISFLISGSLLANLITDNGSGPSLLFLPWPMLLSSLLWLHMQNSAT